jgi:hypothetical protein
MSRDLAAAKLPEMRIGRPAMAGRCRRASCSRQPFAGDPAAADPIAQTTDWPDPYSRAFWYG